MISRLSAISFNTFREAVRDRVLYNLILFALLLVASAPLFGEISIGLEKIIRVNVGLSTMLLFAIIIAIFIGIGLVSKEIEKKTLYTILSRPVRRWEFIAGKYLGLLMTLVVNAAFMTLGFYLALIVISRGLGKDDALLLVGIYFIILEFFIVTAITLLFSSFSTPIFAAIFAFALFMIGTFAEDLRNFAALSTGLTKWLATVAVYLVPNFASLNVISQVAHAQPVSGQLILFNTLYALLYITTELDPHLIVAYEFGSVFLSQKPPEGAGQPDKAVALVEKGIRANPDYWRLYFTLGYIHYFDRKDYKAAEQAFEKGSENPNALPWMKVMAAAMAQHAGEPATAMEIWQRLYENSEDKMIRENAAQHIAAIRVDQSIPDLERRVEM